VDNVVSSVENRQPVIIRINENYYLKVDKTAIPLTCSCFCEAVEYCFMTFFTFNVEYPKNIRFFYYLLETILKVKGLKTKVKGATLTDFLRAIKSSA
jgi:hypothetical protein